MRTNRHIENRHLSITRLSAILVAMLLAMVVYPNSTASAAIEAVQFDDPLTQQRYQDLIGELRCLVCQNQNLADSDAGLAKDLRQKTEEMLKAGKSDQQILDYMRERYGDFVLYRPPFNLATSLLWLGPFLLVGIVLIAVLVSIKKRKNTPTQLPDIDQKKRAKARQLIDQ